MIQWVVQSNLWLSSLDISILLTNLEPSIFFHMGTTYHKIFPPVLVYGPRVAHSGFTHKIFPPVLAYGPRVAYSDLIHKILDPYPTQKVQFNRSVILTLLKSKFQSPQLSDIRFISQQSTIYCIHTRFSPLTHPLIGNGTHTRPPFSPCGLKEN